VKIVIGFLVITVLLTVWLRVFTDAQRQAAWVTIRPLLLPVFVALAAVGGFAVYAMLGSGVTLF